MTLKLTSNSSLILSELFLIKDASSIGSNPSFFFMLCLFTYTGAPGGVGLTTPTGFFSLCDSKIAQ